MNAMQVWEMLSGNSVASTVNRSFALGFWVTVALATSAIADESQSEFWLRQAESACGEVEDGDAADRAFARLHAVYVEWGEITEAQRITQRIKNREQRARAHIAMATHYAEAGNAEECKRELNQAKSLAVKPRLRDELVEAYLHLAKSPPLAISYIIQQHDDPRAREKLCQALARHGHLDEAWKIADNEKHAKQQFALKLTTALAAAKAARIEDTEQAVRHVMISNEYKYSGQGIWCALAEALYRKGDMESARKYAARVTDKYTRRTHRDLRRIAKGVPPDAPDRTKRSFGARKSRLTESLRKGDAEQVERLLEADIAIAEKHPIEATSGQFGPWNQTGQLARIRLRYAHVAALYSKAGNQQQATMKMSIAEEAIQTLMKVNAFAAMVSLGELLRTQLAMDDIDGLISSTTAAAPSLWLMSADPIVSKVLSSGDVDGAKNIAKRALSVKAGFGSPLDRNRSEVISCFIEAGETQAAHELVNASELAELTAIACENAGRAMIKTDRGQLLRTPKWRNDIGAFQRAHLSIGAAIMSKENGKAN